MKTNEDFGKGADNVYRTNKYIVSQRVSTDRKGTMQIKNTYYARTPERDRAFKIYNSDPRKKDGSKITAR